MIENKFFEVLFDRDEYICRGDMYSTSGSPVFPTESGHEFFTVNPLDPFRDHAHYEKESYEPDKPRRADMNVSSFRNFVFEMDGLPLEEQKALLEATSLPWATVTFSGSKSLHAILSLSRPLEAQVHTFEGLQEYKRVWRMITGYIDKIAKEIGVRAPDIPSVIDGSCQNASRFTRYPNSIRPKKGTLQEVLSIGDRMSPESFDDLLTKCPTVHISDYEYINLNRPEKLMEDEEEFIAVAPRKLWLDYIKYTTWGAPEGAYKWIFRICMWAIDDLNASQELVTSLVDRYVIPRLKYKHGYYDPNFRSVHLAIKHAYRKGELKYGRI